MGAPYGNKNAAKNYTKKMNMKGLSKTSAAPAIKANKAWKKTQKQISILRGGKT